MIGMGKSHVSQGLGGFSIVAGLLSCFFFLRTFEPVYGDVAIVDIFIRAGWGVIIATCSLAFGGSSFFFRPRSRLGGWGLVLSCVGLLANGVVVVMIML
jgi:hypothetical protein